MKSRITTDYLLFFKEVENRLNQLFSSDSVLLYSALLTISPGAYSVQVVNEQNPFLLVRRWDTEYMSNNQVSGIYSLDGIVMREERIDLSQNNVNKLLDPRILNNIAISDHNKILLGGVRFYLAFCTKNQSNTYSWQLSEQLNKAVQELIGTVHGLAGFNNLY